MLYARTRRQALILTQENANLTVIRFDMLSKQAKTITLLVSAKKISNGTLKLVLASINVLNWLIMPLESTQKTQQPALAK